MKVEFGKLKITTTKADADILVELSNNLKLEDKCFFTAIAIVVIVSGAKLTMKLIDLNKKRIDEDVLYESENNDHEKETVIH